MINQRAFPKILLSLFFKGPVVLFRVSAHESNELKSNGFDELKNKGDLHISLWNMFEVEHKIGVRIVEEERHMIAHNEVQVVVRK